MPDADISLLFASREVARSPRQFIRHAFEVSRRLFIIVFATFITL